MFIDRKIIPKQKARTVGLFLSTYLRKIGLTGQVVTRTRAFPKEILQFTGTLNHLAANLNQITKNRNSWTI